MPTRLSVLTPPYRFTSAKSKSNPYPNRSTRKVVESPRKVVGITRKIVESLVLTAGVSHWESLTALLQVFYFSIL